MWLCDQCEKNDATGGCADDKWRRAQEGCCRGAGRMGAGGRVRPVRAGVGGRRGSRCCGSPVRSTTFYCSKEVTRSWSINVPKLRDRAASAGHESTWEALSVAEYICGLYLPDRYTSCKNTHIQATESFQVRLARAPRCERVQFSTSRSARYTCMWRERTPREPFLNGTFLPLLRQLLPQSSYLPASYICHSFSRRSPL